MRASARETGSVTRGRPYKEYIRWLQKQDQKKAETFWKQELQGFTNAVRLGIERERLEDSSQNLQAEITVSMGREATEKVEAFARSLQITLNSLVQGAWAILLSRHSGERDIVFGAAVSGRSAPIRGIESMLGLFFNTLPFRVQLQGDETVGEYLKSLQAKQALIQEFEYSPLLKVQKWSDVPRGRPLFEYMIVFANYAQVQRPRKIIAAVLRRAC